VDTREIRLLQAAPAPLAGAATCLAGAAQAALVALGDDRGEVIVLDAAGRTVLGARLPAAALGLALAHDGSVLAMLDRGGRLRVVTDRGRVLFDATHDGATRICMAPVGDCYHVVHGRQCRVEVLNGTGRPIRSFEIPAGVIGYAVDGPDGGAAMITRDGTLVRMTGWGKQIWARDLAHPAAGLALDAGGTFLSVALQHRGAQNFLPGDGMAFGGAQLASPVRCVAVAGRHLLLGGRDGTVSLHSRSGERVAALRFESPPADVHVNEEATLLAARLEDGSVRLLRLDEMGAWLPHQDVDGDARPLVRHPLRKPRWLPRAAWIALSPDGGTVAATTDEGRLRLLDARGETQEETSFEGTLLGLRAYDDGSALLVTSRHARGLGQAGENFSCTFPLAPAGAHLPPAGDTFATHDEFGGIVLHDRRSGAQLLHAPADPGSATQRVLAYGRHLIGQRSEGRFDIVSEGAASSFSVPLAGGAAPRLVAATAAGPVVARGHELLGFGWNGEPAWQHGLPGLAGNVLQASSGAILVRGDFGIALLHPDGRPYGHPLRTQGRPIALVGEPDDPILVLRDGRRLVVVTAAGRPLWRHGLRVEPEAVVASDDGRRLAALVANDLVLLEDPARHIPPGPAPAPADGDSVAAS